MARNPAKPERHVLTVEQGRSCIARLQDCIRRLEDFDPQQVQKRFNIPEVVALEAAIDDALAAAFGHGSPSYDRYKRAASLDSGPRIGTARLSPTWGPGPQVAGRAPIPCRGQAAVDCPFANRDSCTRTEYCRSRTICATVRRSGGDTRERRALAQGLRCARTR